MKIKKLLILSSLLLLTGCVPTDYSKQLFIGNTEFKAEVANTSDALAKGLSDRKSIDEDEAMIFFFPKLDSYSFWMKDMNFPIDIIWLQGSKIVGAEENVDFKDQEKLYKPPMLVNAVIEVKAGTYERIGKPDHIKFNKNQ